MYSICPDDQFLDFDEIPTILFSQTFVRKAMPIMEQQPPCFICERNSCGSTAGIELSRRFQVPFVLDYNGSEVWIGTNAVGPYQNAELLQKIEDLNLRLADLVVVLSKPAKDEIIQRGVEKQKILVNPSGVDPEKYSPSIGGAHIRKKLRLEGKTVIGFIGTFGKWQGAEVLAESFGRLIKKFPEYRDKVHLLMIGDGATVSQSQQMVCHYGVQKSVTFTGTVPQDQGPEYLARISHKLC